MKFQLLTYTGVKPHVVREDLYHHLLLDLEERFGPQEPGKWCNSEYLDKIAIDMPGMVMADRQWAMFELEGVKVSIPYSDVEAFFNQLKNLDLRLFSDGTSYYKLHGWQCCIVMSVQDRVDLLKQMQKSMPKVKEVAEAEEQEFLRRLSAINKDRIVVASHRDGSLAKVLGKDFKGSN